MSQKRLVIAEFGSLCLLTTTQWIHVVLFCLWVFTGNVQHIPFPPPPGVYSSLSSSAGSGSPRSQTLQYPILSAIWAAWIPEDWRLWFCQAAQSREWAAHDTLLHSKLCRSLGFSTIIQLLHTSVSSAFTVSFWDPRLPYWWSGNETHVFSEPIVEQYELMTCY